MLDATALATLPERALGWLAQLREVGRWGTAEADYIKRDLERVAKVAERRSQGAERPPFGLAHSEFHPTSVHIGPGGMRILDWARAYAGNGLLDLVSWQGTRDPLDLDKVSDLIEAYVAAGGPTEARAERGGLPAHVWASGWDKMWVCEWLMEGTTRWADASMDASLQETIGRHLREVVTCLTD